MIVEPGPTLLDLLVDAPDWVRDSEPDTLERRFWAFHKANPAVYVELVRLARQASTIGRTRLGIAMLFEVLRWNRAIAGLPDESEDFKLNNSYRSRYARLVMEREPDLAGLFALRELRTA